MKKRIPACTVSILFALFLIYPLQIRAQVSVDNTSPDANSTNVARNSDIIINFSGGIDKGTVDNTTFKVRGEQSGEFTGTFPVVSTSSAISFDPDNNFKPGEKITVTLTDGIQNLIPYAFSFVASANSPPEDPAFFADNTVTTNTDGATSVAATDLDGDGDLDLISTSQFDNKIAWYENTDGTGNYGPQQVIATSGNFALSVVAADLDGDGDQDLAAAFYGTGITWYENTDGAGSFGPQQVVTTNADGASSVAAADLDSDGDLDIISASAGDNKIAWYENTDGGGSFGPQQEITTNADGAYSVTAADLDGDGDIDLSSASRNGDTIAWYENTDGAGSFGPQQVVTANANGASSVAAADLDGDGDLDLASASRFDNKIAWYENTDGAGSFGPQQVVTANANGASSVTAVDLDGDGDLDLSSTSQNDNTIAWYENTDGAGSFNPPQVVTTSAGGAFSLIAADLDGDGDLDLSSASFDGNEIAWYENTSRPSLNITQIQPSSSTPGNTITIYGSGFDSNPSDNTVTFTPVGGGSGTTASVTAGDSNLLTVTIPSGLTGGNYTVSVQRASDSMTFTYPDLFDVSTGGGYFGSSGSQNIISESQRFPEMVPADVDSDGNSDLIAAGLTNDEIFWLKSDGTANPSFTKQVISTDVNSPTSVYAADADGDGDLDIISASAGDDKVAWYENDGAADPGFTQRVVSTNADGVESVYAGDVDGDGDLDLVSASATDDKVAWYENDGAADPDFTEQVVSTNADGAISVYAGDVNGDGDLDLVSASRLDDKIAWYENDGAADPGFTEQVVSTNADGAISVYAGDVNGDGDLDLMSLSAEDDKLAWYENDNGFGSPGSSEHVVSNNAQGNDPNFRLSSVYAADVDGDGDLDLMSATSGDNKIAWYENNNGFGAPGSSEHIVEPLVPLTTFIRPADLDSDGDLDLIYTADGLINWSENSSPPLNITQVKPLTGSAGQKITITGSGFDASSSVNTVTLNPVEGGTGTTAPATVENGNKLTITIPAGLTGGNYRINIERSSDGSDITFPKLFSIATGGGNFSGSGSGKRVVSSGFDAFDTQPADMDGDGDLDLVAVSRSVGKMVWFKNDGNQNFTEQVISTNGAPTVYPADVDADGDLDLITGYYDEEKVSWFENDGAPDPAFTEHVIATNASGIISVFAGDVDGDGDLDLMSAALTNNEVVWYENNGAADPSFTEQIITPDADNPEEIHAQDMDGDGNLDIMSASRSDDKIAWYENNGAANPAFTEHEVSTNTDANANSVYAADVNADGNIDLMSASSEFNSRIAWYESDGTPDPTFTDHVVSSNFIDGYDVRGGDLDGDGDLDLMGAGNFISWFESDGAANPNFSAHELDIGTGSTNSIYVRDLDNDGDLDLMSIPDSDNVVWYENTTPAVTAGQSLALDGNGDFVEIPDANPLDLSNSFTIEGWVHPAPLDTDVQYILGKSGAYSIGISQSLLRFAAEGIQNYDLSYSLPAGQWTHLAAVMDANNDVTFYVNGKSTGTVTGSSPLQTGSSPLRIGQDGSGGGFWGGLLDEIRIWNTVRSGSEIRTYMFQALSGQETDLNSWYRFNEEGGSTTADATTNDNDGMLNGDATFNADTHPYGTFITGNEGWRMMSAPVSGSSYSTLLDTLWTQGFTGADVTGGITNVQTWDEENGWISLSDGTTTPEAGSGFITYVYADDEYETGGIQGGFPKMITVDETQNEGTVSPSLSYTDTGSSTDDGWNLIGNPYGTTIDWDAPLGWTKTNLDFSFYVWSDSANSGSGAYLSWNGSLGTLPDSKIAPWQGFWVQADAVGPVLEMTDQVRSTGGVFLKGSEQPVPQIEFELVKSPPGKGGSGKAGSRVGSKGLQSLAVVMFAEGATPAKDPLDAWKLQSLNQQRYLSLYTTDTERHALDINALPKEIESPLELNLDFRGSDIGGEYTLNWNPKALPTKMSVELKDTYTERVIDLSKAGEYSFEVATTQQKATEQSSLGKSGSGEAGSGVELEQPTHGPIPTVLKAKTTNPRFVLSIVRGGGQQNAAKLPQQVTLGQNYPNPFNPTTVIRYGVPEQTDVQLNVYDVLGRKVRTLVNSQKAAGHYEASFDASSLASGLYFYRLKIGSKILTKKMTLIK